MFIFAGKDKKSNRSRSDVADEAGGGVGNFRHKSESSSSSSSPDSDDNRQIVKKSKKKRSMNSVARKSESVQTSFRMDYSDQVEEVAGAEPNIVHENLDFSLTSRTQFLDKNFKAKLWSGDTSYQKYGKQRLRGARLIDSSRIEPLNTYRDPIQDPCKCYLKTDVCGETPNKTRSRLSLTKPKTALVQHTFASPRWSEGIPGNDAPVLYNIQEFDETSEFSEVITGQTVDPSGSFLQDVDGDRRDSVASMSLSRRDHKSELLDISPSAFSLMAGSDREQSLALARTGELWQKRSSTFRSNLSLSPPRLSSITDERRGSATLNLIKSVNDRETSKCSLSPLKLPRTLSASRIYLVPLSPKKSTQVSNQETVVKENKPVSSSERTNIVIKELTLPETVSKTQQQRFDVELFPDMSGIEEGIKADSLGKFRQDREIIGEDNIGKCFSTENISDEFHQMICELEHRVTQYPSTSNQLSETTPQTETLEVLKSSETVGQNSMTDNIFQMGEVEYRVMQSPRLSNQPSDTTPMTDMETEELLKSETVEPQSSARDFTGPRVKTLSDWEPSLPVVNESDSDQKYHSVQDSRSTSEMVSIDQTQTLTDYKDPLEESDSVFEDNTLNLELDYESQKENQSYEQKKELVLKMMQTAPNFYKTLSAVQAAAQTHSGTFSLVNLDTHKDNSATLIDNSTNDIDSFLNANASLLWNAETGVVSQETSSWTTGGNSNNTTYIQTLDDESDQSKALSLDANVNKNKSRSGNIDLSKFRLVKTFCVGRDRLKIYGKLNCKSKFCSCHPMCAHQPTVGQTCPCLGTGVTDPCDCLCPGRFTEARTYGPGPASRGDHCSAHACVHQFDFSQACINDLGLRLGSSTVVDHRDCSLTSISKPGIMSLAPDLSKTKHQKSVRFSESTLIDSTHCQSDDTCQEVSSGLNTLDNSSSSTPPASQASTAAKSGSDFSAEPPGQQLKKLLNLQLQKFYETTVIKDNSDIYIDWAKAQSHKKQDRPSLPPLSAKQMGSVSHRQSTKVTCPPSCFKTTSDQTADHCHKYTLPDLTKSKASCAEPMVATGRVLGNPTCINQPMKCGGLGCIDDQRDLKLGQIDPYCKRSPKQSDRKETNSEAGATDLINTFIPTHSQLLTKSYRNEDPLPTTCNYTTFSDVCSKLNPSRNRDYCVDGLSGQDSNLKSESSEHLRFSPSQLAPPPGLNAIKYFDQLDSLKDHDQLHYEMLPLQSSSKDLKRYGDGSDDLDDSFVTAVEDNAWTSLSDVGTKEVHDSMTFTEQQPYLASINNECGTRGKSIFDADTLPKYYMALDRLSPRKSKPKIMHHQTVSFDPSNAEQNLQQRLVSNESNTDGLSFEKSSFTDVNSDLWTSPMRPHRKEDADRSLMHQKNTIFLHNKSPNEFEQNSFTYKEISHDKWQPGQPHLLWSSPSDVSTDRFPLLNRYSEERQTNLKFENVESDIFHEIISEMPSTISARSKGDLLGESSFTKPEFVDGLSPKIESPSELKLMKNNLQINNKDTTIVDGVYTYTSKSDMLPLDKSSEGHTLGKLSSRKYAHTDEGKSSLKKKTSASVNEVLLSVQMKLKKEKENRLYLQKSSSDTSLQSESNKQGDMEHKTALLKKWYSDESFQYKQKKPQVYRSPEQNRSLTYSSSQIESAENVLVSSLALSGDSIEDQTEMRPTTVHKRLSINRPQRSYLGEFSEKRSSAENYENLPEKSTLQNRSSIEYKCDRSSDLLGPATFDLLRKTSERNKAHPSFNERRWWGSSSDQIPTQYNRRHMPERPHKSSEETSDQSIFGRPGEDSSSDESLLCRATLEEYKQHRSLFQKTFSDDDRLDVTPYRRDPSTTQKEFDPETYLPSQSLSKELPDRLTLQREISGKCKLDELSIERKNSSQFKSKKSSLQRKVSNESKAKKTYPRQRTLKKIEPLKSSSDKFKPDDMFLLKSSPHDQIRKLNEVKKNTRSLPKSSSDEWKSDTSDSSLAQQKERLDEFKSPLENVSVKEIQPVKSALRKTSSDRSKLHKRLSFEFPEDHTDSQKTSDKCEIEPSVLPETSAEKFKSEIFDLCDPEKASKKYKPEKASKKSKPEKLYKKSKPEKLAVKHKPEKLTETCNPEEPIKICKSEKLTEKPNPEKSADTGESNKSSLKLKSVECKVDKTKSVEPGGHSTLREDLKEMTTDEESKSFKSITSFDFSLDKLCQNQSQNKHEDSVSELLFTPCSSSDDRNVCQIEMSDLNSTATVSITHSLIDFNTEGYHVTTAVPSAADVKEDSKRIETFSLGSSDTNSWIDSSAVTGCEEVLCMHIPTNIRLVNDDISYCEHSLKDWRNQNHLDDEKSSVSQTLSSNRQHRFTAKSPGVSKRNLCQSSQIVGYNESDLKVNILDVSSIDLVISGEVSAENMETTQFQLTMCQSSNSNALQTVDKMCGTDGSLIPQHSLQTVYRESLSVYDNFSNDSSMASDKLCSSKDTSSAPASSTFVTAISELRDDLTYPHTVQPHLKAQDSCNQDGQLEETEEFFSVSYQSNLDRSKQEAKSLSETDTHYYSPAGCRPTSQTVPKQNLQSVPSRKKEVFRQKTPKVLSKSVVHTERRLEASQISLDQTLDQKPSVYVEKMDQHSPTMAEPVILDCQTAGPNDEKQSTPLDVPDVKATSNPFFTTIKPTSISFHQYHPTKAKLRQPHWPWVSRKKSYHAKTKCKRKQPAPSAGFYKHEVHTSPDGEVVLFKPLENTSVQQQEIYEQSEQTPEAVSKTEDQSNIDVGTDRENIKYINELSVELNNLKSSPNISMDFSLEMEDDKNRFSIDHSKEMKDTEKCQNFFIDFSEELKVVENCQPFSKDEELKNNKSCQNVSGDFSEFRMGQSREYYSRTPLYWHRKEFFSDIMPSDDYDWVNFPSTSENTLSDISSDVFDKSGLNDIFQPLSRTGNVFSIHKSPCLNPGLRYDNETLAKDTSAGVPAPVMGGALHTKDLVSAFICQEGQRMSLRRESPDGTQQCEACCCQSEKFEKLKIEYTSTVCYQRPTTGIDACHLDYHSEEKKMTVISDIQEPLPPDSLSGMSFEVRHSHSKPRSKHIRQHDTNIEHSVKTTPLRYGDLMHLEDSRKMFSAPSRYSSKVSGQELLVEKTNMPSRHHSNRLGGQSQDELTASLVHHSSTFDNQLQDEFTAALVYQSRGSFTSSDQRSDTLCLQSCCRQHPESFSNLPSEPNYARNEASSEMYCHLKPKEIGSAGTSFHSKSGAPLDKACQCLECKSISSQIFSRNLSTESRKISAQSKSIVFYGDEERPETYQHPKPKTCCYTETSSYYKSGALLDKEYQCLECESFSPRRFHRNVTTKSRKMSAPSDSVVLLRDRYHSSNSKSSTFEYSHFKTNARCNAKDDDETSFNHYGHERNPSSYYGSFSPFDSLGEYLKPDTVQSSARHSRSKSQSKRSQFFEKY